MGKSRFIELMAKRLDHSASEAELKELELFLEQFPRYKKMQQVTDALQTRLNQPSGSFQDSEIDHKLDALWVSIKNSNDAEPETTGQVTHTSFLHYRRWMAAAAAVLILAVGGFLFYKNSRTAPGGAPIALMHRINVPYGRMVQVVLPDGTRVKLNSGSHFAYPSFFTGNKRNVTLDGEGFFEVTKNAAAPFLVHTAQLTVRVLGTVFNVKAYKEDKRIETTLLKGKVQVELTSDPEKNIILSPHEKLTVTNDLGHVAPPENKGADVARMKYELSTLPALPNEEYQENAWIDNKIVFTNNDFEDVARQMERKYNVHIIFEDERLKREQISGVLKDESLETALQLLKQITSFSSKTEGANVYLTSLKK